MKFPALSIHGYPNFDYAYGVGFSTEHFLKLKENIDDISWRAIYMREPIEREGLLYQKDELQYFHLPKENPDAIIAVCDNIGQGKHYVWALFEDVFGVGLEVISH